MTEVKFKKILVFTNALVPLALLLWDLANNELGANPVEFFLRSTGVLTLVFVFLTLAVTPMRRIFGWNDLIKLRRMLGLFSFFYALLHLTTYFVFDRGLDAAGTVEDVIQRPFIALGMLAFLMLVPLAVTSTNKMVKRLGGKRWARLHRLTYAVAILGVIHFWMIVKSDVFYPAMFALVLAALLGYRIYKKLKPAAAPAAPLARAPE